VLVLYNAFTYVVTDVEVKVTIKRLKCLRCGHEWVPRTNDVRQCPRCKSAFWNVPKNKTKQPLAKR
jgi:Zn finger protein HypA/HybF involved in hydrogenase expression